MVLPLKGKLSSSPLVKVCGPFVMEKTIVMDGVDMRGGSYDWVLVVCVKDECDGWGREEEEHMCWYR